MDVLHHHERHLHITHAALPTHTGACFFREVEGGAGIFNLTVLTKYTETHVTLESEVSGLRR